MEAVSSMLSVNYLLVISVTLILMSPSLINAVMKSIFMFAEYNRSLPPFRNIIAYACFTFFVLLFLGDFIMVYLVLFDVVLMSQEKIAILWINLVAGLVFLIISGIARYAE